MTALMQEDAAKKSPRVGTMDHRGRRRWLYPDRRSGPKSAVRKKVAILLVVFYLVAPWLTWNGSPLIRLDVLAKKAYFFGLVFHLSDAAFVAPVLAIGALILLFATSVKGRLWCAYGCPQTVFVEWVIRPIEELTEGSAHHRRRMDAMPMTPRRFARKVVKHSLFLVVAALVANTFLSFFFGPSKVLGWMMGSPAEHPGPFFVMSSVMGLFYADLAWFREQFCAFVCPYARFQSVMIDNDTPTVAYDVSRGEPRGRSSNAVAASVQAKGDCIDCALCVRVCPTGIDIREGLQLECIRCARCMDACDTIMTNIGKPKGLIRIATQAELSGEQPKPFWKRPKVLAFAFALLVFSAVLAARLGARGDIGLTVSRAPGSVYTQMPDGRLGNVFLIHVNNNSSVPIKLEFDVNEKPAVELLCALCGSDVKPYDEIRVTVIAAFRPDMSNKSVKITHRSTAESVTLPLLGPR